MQIERESDIRVMDQLDVTERQGSYQSYMLCWRRTGPELRIELTKADMTSLWIRQEFDTKSKLLPGSAQWIALGVHIGEQQSVL